MATCCKVLSDMAADESPSGPFSRIRDRAAELFPSGSRSKGFPSESPEESSFSKSPSKPVPLTDKRESASRPSSQSASARPKSNSVSKYSSKPSSDSSVRFASIWNRTDVALRKVNHIVFCGYSFPDADIHIKYLLKRAQTNRVTPLRFTVINHYPRKKKSESDPEQERYQRFLGRNVNYTKTSFQNFIADPLAVLRP
jgi:hypothetical protein